MSSESIDLLLWCATYLVHSSLAVLAVFVLQSRAGARVRDVLWKVALVLPFATATFQAEVHRRVPALDRAPTIAVEVVPENGAPTQSLLAIALETGQGPDAAGALPALDARAGEEPGQPPVGGRGRAPKAWHVGALTLFLLWWMPSFRLALALRGRRRLVAGRLIDDLEELRGRARFGRSVRLSVSDRIGSPVAFGLLRPEISLPPRTSHLAPELARAVLAHELAHHARGDLFWCRLARTLRWAFVFQPMLVLVERRIAASGEVLADDLAVRWTRDGRGLARSLAVVAEWQRGRVVRGGAIAMVDERRGRSALAERVERALRPTRERGARGAGPLGIVLAIVAAAAAPRIERFERYDSVAGPYGAALDRIYVELVDLEGRVDRTSEAERERLEGARRTLLDLARVVRSRAWSPTQPNR